MVAVIVKAMVTTRCDYVTSLYDDRVVTVVTACSDDHLLDDCLEACTTITIITRNVG